MCMHVHAGENPPSAELPQTKVVSGPVSGVSDENAERLRQLYRESTGYYTTVDTDIDKISTLEKSFFVKSFFVQEFTRMIENYNFVMAKTCKDFMYVTDDQMNVNNTKKIIKRSVNDHVIHFDLKIDVLDLDNETGLYMANLGVDIYEEYIYPMYIFNKPIVRKQKLLKSFHKTEKSFFTKNVKYSARESRDLVFKKHLKQFYQDGFLKYIGCKEMDKSLYKPIATYMQSSMGDVVYYINLYENPFGKKEITNIIE